eukprot:scaffold4357_cov113-Isochrysis_galbana.AAC.20
MKRRAAHNRIDAWTTGRARTAWQLLCAISCSGRLMRRSPISEAAPACAPPRLQRLRAQAHCRVRSDSRCTRGDASVQAQTRVSE